MLNLSTFKGLNWPVTLLCGIFTSFYFIILVEDDYYMCFTIELIILFC